MKKLAGSLKSFYLLPLVLLLMPGVVNAQVMNYAPLEKWVGKLPTDLVENSNFLDHPLMQAAAKKGIPAALVKQIAGYAYHQPVEKTGHYLVLQGASCLEECGSKPGIFEVKSYAILVDIAPDTGAVVNQPHVLVCWQQFRQTTEQGQKKYENVVYYYTDNGENREMRIVNRHDNNGGCTGGNEYYDAQEVVKHLSLAMQLFEHLRFSGFY